MSSFRTLIFAAIFTNPLGFVDAYAQDVNMTYSTSVQKELVIREIVPLEVQTYIPPYKLPISGILEGENLRTPESVVVRYLTALINENNAALLSLVDDRQRRYVLSEPDNASEDAKELYTELYKNRDVYITHRVRVLGTLMLSVVSYKKSSGKLVSRLPFFLRHYNGKWKVTALPPTDVASALAAHFPVDGGEIVRQKVGHGVSTVGPFD